MSPTGQWLRAGLVLALAGLLASGTEAAGRWQRHSQRGPRAQLHPAFAFGERDPFEVLGVHRSASERAVKKAYRKAALASHPDKDGSEEAFLLVKAAFETVSDPELRRDFRDAERTPRSRPPPPSASYGGSWTWGQLAIAAGVLLLALPLVMGQGSGSPPAQPRRTPRPDPPAPAPAEPSAEDAVADAARAGAPSALRLTEGCIPGGTGLRRCVVVGLTDADAKAGAAWPWLQRAARAVHPDLRLAWCVLGGLDPAGSLVAAEASRGGVPAGAPFAVSLQYRGRALGGAARTLAEGSVGESWSAGPALVAFCERVVGGEVPHAAGVPC